MPTLDAAALAEMAIFPLPDAVLFPGAILPLHIFEPRYRAMTDHVLASTRMMAVVRLRPGFQSDYHGRPPIYDVACVGTCIADDRLPDGRYNLMLRGVARIHIEEELAPVAPYRVVRAQLLGDARSTRVERLEPARLELIAICDRLAGAIPEGGDALRRLARAMPEPGACADVVAAALVRDADVRQSLLELLDPADRLEQTMAYAAALLGQFKADPSAIN